MGTQEYSSQERRRPFLQLKPFRTFVLGVVPTTSKVIFQGATRGLGESTISTAQKYDPHLLSSCYTGRELE
jgi:hypothetical protein